ncbi:MAG: hypothetical protein HZB38_11935 [Planctomycetes bacterium]|nr:hypothetical protein [Planctomycetota bacterium]
MNRVNEQLEREVDAGLKALAPLLDVPPPDGDTMQRLIGRVIRESRREAKVFRLLRRGWLATGAAACLALGLTRTLWTAGQPAGPASSAQELANSISDWVEAATESNEDLRRLYGADWSEDVADNDVGRDDIRDALDSVDESIDAIESVLGA